MSVCPICNKRAAKRSCPALRTKICAVCCARERMIELACPDSCAYLSDARTQMGAREVEWREREREAGIIRPELGKQWLAYLLMTQHAIVNAHRGIEGTKVADLTNTEILEALDNAIKNLQTGTSGLIYEHRAASPRVEEVSRRIRAALDKLVERMPAEQRPRPNELINVLNYERAAVEGHLRRGEDARSHLRYISLYLPWPEEKTKPLILT
jgi:hypothetical protein